MSNWLVTGGAGYIGAHVVRSFRERSEDVVVLDDLSTGDASRVGDATLVVGSILDPEVVREVLDHHDIRGIVHIAAKKQVGESVADPLLYYRQNVAGTLCLLEAAAAAGVDSFVFSSSAAVYGMPDVDLVDEDTPLEPLSPYGETKLIGERMCRAVSVATGLRVILLRYFNVAGAASPDLGDRGEFNLIPLALRALTSGTTPKIFGADYPTPDGTCIRDYVHVVDIADAHAAAGAYLADGGKSATYNVGRGQGASVREVLGVIADVTGMREPPEVVARRAGDPARIVAATDRIRHELGWTATHDLVDMITSAWDAWPR